MLSINQSSTNLNKGKVWQNVIKNLCIGISSKPKGLTVKIFVKINLYKLIKSALDSNKTKCFRKKSFIFVTYYKHSSFQSVHINLVKIDSLIEGLINSLQTH